MSFQVNSTDLKPGTEIKESVATAEEEFKNSTDEETEGKHVPEDEEELKRKLDSEDEDVEEHCYKHCPFPITPEYHCRARIGTLSGYIKAGLCLRKIKGKDFPLEDRDDEEEKEISRTQSMDNLLLMQEPQHQ